MRKIVEKISTRAGLMDRMVDKLELRDAIAQMPDATFVLQGAAARCLTCRQAAACEAVLERQDLDRAPGFCRNRDLFDFVAG